MNIALSEPVRAALRIVGCAMLWSLESIIPFYRGGAGRVRRALPNVGLTVLLLVTNLALSFAAAWTSAASRRESGMPAWLHAVVGIAALHLFAYFAHVLLHKMPFAWRFHRVHHSDEAVDVTTAFRQHPGESAWHVLWQLPAIAKLRYGLDGLHDRPTFLGLLRMPF